MSDVANDPAFFDLAVDSAERVALERSRSAPDAELVRAGATHLREVRAPAGRLGKDLFRAGLRRAQFAMEAGTDPVTAFRSACFGTWEQRVAARKLSREEATVGRAQHDADIEAVAAAVQKIGLALLPLLLAAL